MGEFHEAVAAYEVNEKESWRRAALVAGYSVAPYRKGGRPLTPEQILREPEEMQSPEALAAYLEAEIPDEPGKGPTNKGDKAAAVMTFKAKRDAARKRMREQDKQGASA